MRTDSAPKRDAVAPPRARTTVLIADGDPMQRALLGASLVASGGDYVVLEASTVPDALMAMRRQPMGPQTSGLVFVDSGFGGLSDLSLLSSFASTGESWAIVVMVGKAESTLEVEPLFAAGADDLVPKKRLTSTLTANGLRRVVDSALARAKVRVARAGDTEDLRGQLALERRLIGIVGHDLRTPLSALLIALDSLHSELPNHSLISLATRSGVRIRDMVKQLLDFTRVREAASFPLKHTHVELIPLLEQVAREHRVLSGREVFLRTDGALSGSMDKSAIGQLASNLVANALAHGDQDRPVWIHADREGEQLVLRVINHGADIPTPELERMFNPFVRGAGGEGLGLGLYIVRSIIDSHGGELTARSAAGETEFVARWPCAASAACAQAAASVVLDVPKLR